MKFILVFFAMSLIVIAPALAQSWDNSSFNFRQPITISNTNQYPIFNMFTINITFDHQSLVNAQKSNDTGNDIRIYCGGVQKHRVNITAWNQASTNIIFRMDEFNITNGNFNTCYMYYGNNTSIDPAPQNKTYTYLAYADFDGANGVSDVAKFVNDPRNTNTTLMTNQHRMNFTLNRTTPFDAAVVNYSLLTLPEYPLPFYFSMDTQLLKDTGEANAGGYWYNATSFESTMGMISDNYSAVRCRELNNELQGINIVNRTAQSVIIGGGCPAWDGGGFFVLATNMTYNLTNITFYSNTTNIISSTEAEGTSSKGYKVFGTLGIGTFADGGAAYAIDNFIARVYSPNEPIMTFGAEQSLGSVSIQSPINITYNITRPNLNFTFTNTSVVTNCFYSVNNGANITLPGCSNASGVGNLGFNQFRVWVNFSGAYNFSEVNYTLNYLNMSRCNGINTNLVLNFTYRYEETDTLANDFRDNGNVFEATFNTYDYALPSILTNFTFNLTNSSYYDICVSNVAQFTTDTTIRYYNTSYSTRFYYLDRYNASGSAAQNISLFLLGNSDSSPVSFEIRESDGVTGANDVIIYADRFYTTQNAYKTVSSARTDSDGNAFTYLKMNTVEYRIRLFRNGTLENTIGKSVFGGDAAVGLTRAYTLAATVITDIVNFWLKTLYGCTVSNTTAIVTCVYDDPTNNLNQMFLTVAINATFNPVRICQTSSTAVQDVLTCNLSSSGNGTYFYWLQGKYGADNTPHVIDSGSFTIGLNIPFGREGLIFAVFLIIAMSMLGSYNPTVTIFMGIIALVISVGMGFVVVGASALVGIIIVGFIAAYKQRS